MKLGPVSAALGSRPRDAGAPGSWQGQPPRRSARAPNGVPPPRAGGPCWRGPCGAAAPGTTPLACRFSALPSRGGCSPAARQVARLRRAPPRATPRGRRAPATKVSTAAVLSMAGWVNDHLPSPLAALRLRSPLVVLLPFPAPLDCLTPDRLRQSRSSAPRPPRGRPFTLGRSAPEPHRWMAPAR